MKYLFLTIAGLYISTSHVEYITVKDAEKILGEAVKQVEKNTVKEKGILKNTYVFKAIAKDNQAPNGHNLYCTIEDYPDINSSAKSFMAVKVSNQHMPGFRILGSCGDEGNIQTDNHNFYFMIVRKGKKILKMKLNKISIRSSFKIFEEIGRQICFKM